MEQAEKSAANIEDEAQEAFALMKIATAWAQLGQFRQAARVFEKAATSAEAIPDSNRRGTTLMLIAKAQAEVGEWRPAAKTAERSETPNRNCKEWALAQLGLVQAKAGNLEEALATVDSIREDRRSLAQRLVSAHQVEAGDLKGAQSTADQIQDASDKVQALATLAPAYAKAGQKDLAEESLRIALDASKALEDGNPDINSSRKAGALMWIAKARVQMGDEKRTMEIAEPLKSSLPHERVMAEVAKSRFRAGNIAEALAIVKPFRGSWKEDTLREFARAQIAAGEFKAAHVSIEAMGPFMRLQKSDALLQAAAEHLKQGDAAAAKAIFKDVHRKR